MLFVNVIFHCLFFFSSLCSVLFSRFYEADGILMMIEGFYQQKLGFTNGEMRAFRVSVYANVKIRV